jgi:hypothetical protein
MNISAINFNPATVIAQLPTRGAFTAADLDKLINNKKLFNPPNIQALDYISTNFAKKKGEVGHISDAAIRDIKLLYRDMVLLSDNVSEQTKNLYRTQDHSNLSLLAQEGDLDLSIRDKTGISPSLCISRKKGDLKEIKTYFYDLYHGGLDEALKKGLSDPSVDKINLFTYLTSNLEKNYLGSPVISSDQISKVKAQLLNALNGSQLPESVKNEFNQVPASALTLSENPHIDATHLRLGLRAGSGGVTFTPTPNGKGFTIQNN